MPYINLPRKQREQSYNKKEASDIYNAPQWKNLRLSKLSNDPLCEDCLSIGIITPAVEVHHITPFMRGITRADKLRLAYDYYNLRSLCEECHDKIHVKLRR